MQTQKEEVRSAILSAAREEFLRKGFKGASIRSVAAAAGVSKSNLYNYFQGKEDILRALCGPASARVRDLLAVFETVEHGASFRDEAFLGRFSGEISRGVSGFLKSHGQELALILEAGEGTEYALLRAGVVDALESHLIEGLPPRNAGDPATEAALRVVTVNLVNGLMQVAHQFLDAEWLDACVQRLIEYHVRGIASLYD